MKVSFKKPYLTLSTTESIVARRDRIVVSTLRCGRSNPGSNPGHGIAEQCHGRWTHFCSSTQF